MRIRDNQILDDQGRTLILRGVNLGGDSKIPFGAPGSEIEQESLNTKNAVSFTGRPFPLEEAQSHLQRLKKAGMTFLRFIVTWEAIEHEGPGIYDEAYLAYLRKVLLTAEKEGISVFIDPHQDVWSRWTGGDGAPAWTMEKLGFNLDNCDASEAAVTRQRYSILRNGKPYPKMIWSCNYNRYAAATMFSLFFAGNTYARDLQIDGENIQDWLQNRYIAAFRHTQRRLKNCAAIAGWGPMNEPHCGFIGHPDLTMSENPVIPIGLNISPWQAIRAASGYTVKAPVYNVLSYFHKDRSRRKTFRYEALNPQNISLFKEGFCCPWKQAGVWQDEDGTPQLINSNYFSQYKGQRVNFADDFLKPFIVKYINAMKEANDQSIFFIEGLPKSTREDAHPSWNKNDPRNTVNAFHWYDGLSLYTKSFRPWFNVDPDTAKIKLGKRNVGKYFTECLAHLINLTKKKMENMPCLLGEFGLPFDMNNRKGFKKGDYSLHEEAISMYYDAVDANLLHSTIWNYTASNTNKYGDGWNDEDLSIFCDGKERAAAGWKRPYPMATAGKPLYINWNRKRGEFIYRFKADSTIKAPTIIYLPLEIFGTSPGIESTLSWEYNTEEQKLFVNNNEYSGTVTIKITVH